MTGSGIFKVRTDGGTSRLTRVSSSRGVVVLELRLPTERPSSATVDASLTASIVPVVFVLCPLSSY